MKTLGLVGGIGPESTIDYYRLLMERFRARAGEQRSPRIIINSIELQPLWNAMVAKDLDSVTAQLVDAVEVLARAGADIALFTANTPHIVFDEVGRRARIPLISIVAAACDAAKAMQRTRLGLFGTRFTMQARFYPEVFSRADIALIVPQADDLNFIHDTYEHELLKGVFLPETRAALLAIVDRMIERDGIDGLLLGGTELPLILRQESRAGVPFLDTTRIHVDRAVAALLG